MPGEQAGQVRPAQRLVFQQVRSDRGDGGGVPRHQGLGFGLERAKEQG